MEVKRNDRRDGGLMKRRSDSVRQRNGGMEGGKGTFAFCSTGRTEQGKERREGGVQADERKGSRR